MVAAKVDNKGLAVALCVIGIWLTSQIFLLTTDWINIVWLLPLLVIWQTHLYTGLFITAHDAMHGTVSPNKKINDAIGLVAAGLFAFNFFPRLLPRHHKHHKHVSSEDDPDYHASHKFWPWYLSFLRNYITVWQVLLMAIAFNVLQLWFDPANVILLWMAPSVLSTLQLFYFGTYVPHKGEFNGSNPHHASTLANNHWYAFATCYFFGYHFEHHERPYVPWWQLWTLKNDASAQPMAEPSGK
jgi:beta-carotene/zeaxanthin 4-ketolase